MYSFRFRTNFEGETGLLVMFKLYENIIPSLDITPLMSFFAFKYFFGTKR